MLKREEFNDPESCLNRARADELIFVLLGRDVAAPDAIRAWVYQRCRAGKNNLSDQQIVDALAVAHRMEKERRAVSNDRRMRERRASERRLNRV